MGMHTTLIGKHKFVCGLFWQSLSRPRELAREARDLAQKIDCDLMVLRKEYATAQAGFAHSEQTARGALYSLAIAVAQALAQEYDGQNQSVHNWLGAFRLDDEHWAYFAVRDANFLPNGDFAGSRDAVFERLHGDYGMGGWNLVVGDAELEDYGFHNFSARRLADLLPLKNGQLKLQRTWMLQPLKRRIDGHVGRRRLWLGLGATTLAVVVAGAAGWQQYRARQQEALQARWRPPVRPVAPAPAPHPWRLLPAPLALAQACVAALTHLTPGGWLLQDYSCAAGGVSYIWLRQDSTIALLLAEVPEAIPDLSGDRATYRTPLALAAGGDEALTSWHALLPPLQSRLQAMHIDARFSALPAPVPAAGAARTDGTAAPDWNTYAYKLESGRWRLADLAALLEQPGVRLEKLSYHDGSWSLEGVIYAK